MVSSRTFLDLLRRELRDHVAEEVGECICGMVWNAGVEMLQDPLFQRGEWNWN